MVGGGSTQLPSTELPGGGGLAIREMREADRGYAAGGGYAANTPPGTHDAAKTNVVATRVAKACVPCSTKKRRCDGGKPQCKVCMVLATECSYETRGLKRGPPKGFRSGPKESAKAKLLRTLETTIRDMALHMGRTEAEREIVRISNERGISMAHAIAQQDGDSAGAVKREHSAPAGPVNEPTPQSDAEDEDVLGISEQGTVRYIGSSSGIQLLHHPPPHQPVPARPSYSPVRAYSHPFLPSPIHLPSVNASRLHGSPSTGSGPSSSGVIHTDVRKSVSKSMNAMLFQHYWSGFHNFWPILYKPALDELAVDRLPDTLDVALIHAIYAIAACVAHPSLDAELEAELGDGPAGEVFAQRAEQYLFQARCTPSPSFASIQCCFLLSCYHQGAGQLSKAYLFSCLANGMAIDLGLHRHLHQYEHDRIERESRSRLIHCIHILSTLLSAEMGRPPMLRSKDIDVPPLSEKESDELDLDSAGRQLHSLSLLNYSRRLFAIVETVLTQVHSFRRKAALRRLGSEGIRRVVDEIDESLEAWRQSLPEWLQLEEGGAKGRKLGPMPSFAAVQVWYYTAKLLLHRPFIPQEEGLALSDLLNDKYHRKCTQAAQSSFELLQRLASASSVDRLSTDLAYIIFTTAVMFVFNARLVQTDGRGDVDARRKGVEDRATAAAAEEDSIKRISTDAKRQFLMCKEWLRKLSDRWPSASAHKQLLDGFSVVGEGVVGGESHQYVGRRPSLLPEHEDGFARPRSAAGYGPTYGDSVPVMPAFEASDVAAPAYLLGGPSQVSAGFPAPYSTVPAPTSIAAADPFDSGATLVAGGVLAQHSLNAYFEFAPNIFDMENVYWNETATRMTPLLAPRDAGAAAMTDNGGNQAQSNADYALFTPRTFNSFPTSSGFAPLGSRPVHALQQQQQHHHHHQLHSMAPPISTAPMSGGGGARPSRITTPRKRTRTDKNQSISSTTSSASGAPLDSPGLQMLAHQAAVQTTHGASAAGNGEEGGSSVYNGDVGGPNLILGTPPPGNSTASTAAIQQSSATVPIGTSYSPFSFHQEPSAPEWGDVISMLQLPPAFIQ